MSLGAIYDDYYENLKENPRNYVGASEIGYCERMIVLKRLHGTQDKDPTLKRVLTLGTWFHSKFIADIMPQLKNYWNMHNAHEPIEIVRSEEGDDTSVMVGDLKGHYDFMYRYINSGITVVVDLKTINSRALQYVKAEGLTNKTHYIKQLEVYIEGTGADYGEIWFIDKDNFDLHIERVDANPASVKESIAKHKRILKHIVDGTLPDKPFETPYDNWMCQSDYCPGTAICWGIEGMAPCATTNVPEVTKWVNKYTKYTKLANKLSKTSERFVYLIAKALNKDEAIVKETPKTKSKKYHYQITPELKIVISEVKTGLSMQIIDKRGGE